MNPTDQEPADTALQQARKALNEKRSAAARHWAAEAARLDPNLEEPWLILGALGTPSESVAYLQRALAINPNSARARSGLEWSLQRLQQSGPDSDEITAPVVVPPAAVPTTGADITAPVAAAASTADDTARLRAIGAPVKPRRRIPLLAWIILTVLVCLGLAAALILPLLGFALVQMNSAEHPLSLQKPTLTMPSIAIREPTATMVFSATVQARVEATAVPTEIPTLTPAPTDTLTPTETAAPTQPAVAQSGGIPVVEITPIEPYRPAPVYNPPEPQYPSPGEYPTAVVSEPQVPVTSGERWVDVNLSNQTAAAYEGDQLIRSFVVSTGTYEHPTVTGQYNIYVKYRYDDMSGPGYYLPDVPYVMYFYSGYGLHGTYWHNNFGTPMSHGCVNFSIDDAAWLFDFASVGTLVNVHY